MLWISFGKGKKIWKKSEQEEFFKYTELIKWKQETGVLEFTGVYT